MYSLSELEQLCRKCKKCRLWTTRKNVVFGEGAKNADIMFIGEGPGEQEDMLGRPFVGKAGKLLDKGIEALGLSRESIYIANIVKCRPPGNRVPEKDEADSCIEYLRWQVKLIDPKVIVLLGSTAGRNILGQDFRITRQRGTLFELGKFKIVPTYHPAAVLRDDMKKADFWSDLKLAIKIYEQIKNC
ncbi:uracil-DNA glycosylase, family 4 [Peptoclostridium acidaminophilum DSM 3953]|uniref:Type-4 uracil-DNA glycosylase n=1 Tax=Peptoclostridium acidaminophilum DSM 3953 TaxID=1286171 RepID=W8TGS1_PEPAC|nr:uracil-DNA glycosylase [Peptoclostridium acidaminophilum]AHM55382.1 uracil-DNA glycosylase, family 4 [Peptoclostridium acidaminophilum DSM 3953]